MILGIFIGACLAFVLVGILLSIMGICNVKRNIRMHDELMDWHERSLRELKNRNEYTLDMINALKTISNAIACKEG